MVDGLACKVAHRPLEASSCIKLELRLISQRAWPGALPWLAAAMVLLTSTAAAAAPPRLVKDVKVGAGNGAPYDDRGAFDQTGHFYFIGDNGTQGAEAWSTDGTTAGTRLAADLVPGSYGLIVPSVAAVNGRVLVSLVNVSDSTTPAPIVEPQVNETFGRTYPGGTRAWFFSGVGNAGATRLWRTEGTSATTTMVKQFSESGSLHPVGNIAVNGATAYFPETTSAAGTELWKSDGTAAGTVLVSDAVAGVGSLAPAELTPLGSGIIFTGTSPAGGKELWTSNGTAGGTFQLADINPGVGSGIGTFARFGVGAGHAFFIANSGAGAELWTTDGTAAGTKPLRAAADKALKVYGPGVEWKGEYWFLGLEDGVTALFKTNGTDAGTSKVLSIGGASLPSNDGTVAVFDGALYFSGGVQAKLWTSDGTAAGTTIVAGSPTVSGSLFATTSHLFFFGKDATQGQELVGDRRATRGAIRRQGRRCGRRTRNRNAQGGSGRHRW